MSKRLFSLVSALAVIALLLMTLPFGAKTQAATSTPETGNATNPDTGTGKKPAPTTTTTQLLTPATLDDEEVIDDSVAGRYIVWLKGEPLASYVGGVPGLAPTSPLATGGRKLNTKSAAVAAYASYLATERAQAITDLSKAVGRPLKPLYTYDAAFNGFVVELTGAEARQTAGLTNIVKVEREKVYTLDTDAGPKWIKADKVWDGTATGLYVATILGSNEVPPVNSAAKGFGTFSYISPTLTYQIRADRHHADDGPHSPGHGG